MQSSFVICKVHKLECTYVQEALLLAQYLAIVLKPAPIVIHSQENLILYIIFVFFTTELLSKDVHKTVERVNVQGKPKNDSLIYLREKGNF